MSACYISESVIRGHRVSKAHFTPVIGRVLYHVQMKEGIYNDFRSPSSPDDIYAVAVKDDVQVR